MAVKINEGVANSLQIILPAKGQTGWSNIVREAFQEIGDHDHSGGGKGTKINSNGIEDNAIKNEHLSSEITLASLGDVQDTDQSAANLAGKILTFSNGAFRPLEFNSQNFTDIDTVININTQTELDGTTFPRGSVVSVRNTTGTGYPSGAADFSSNTLDGITIVADYSVKTSIITNCTIMCSDTVELAGLTTNCKIHSNNNLTLSSGNVVSSNLHADTLISSNSATIAIQKSNGFFNDLNVTNSNLSVADTSVIEAKTITSLSGTPTVSAGTGPYKIVGGVVRKQVLPETANNGEFLVWNNSANEWQANNKLAIHTSSTQTTTIKNNDSHGIEIDVSNPNEYPILKWSQQSSRFFTSRFPAPTELFRPETNGVIGQSGTEIIQTSDMININYQTSGSGQTSPGPANRFIFVVPNDAFYIVKKVEIQTFSGGTMGSKPLVFNAGNLGNFTGSGTFSSTFFDAGSGLAVQTALPLIFTGGLTPVATAVSGGGGGSVTTYIPRGVLFPSQTIKHSAPQMQGGINENYSIKFYVYKFVIDPMFDTTGGWVETGNTDKDPFNPSSW
tara:strand:+ start:1918 stop:3600 length:1683 start_codon:yes stop_codon:yes gene_type:complete